MLVRSITEKFEIPHEPGQWAIIRKLSWKQLRDARDAGTDASLEKMKRVGGDLITVFNKLNEETKRQSVLVEDRKRLESKGLQAVIDVGAQAPDATPDDAVATVAPTRPKSLLAGFDLERVLTYGVANLSYTENYSTGDVLELDEKTAVAIGDAILRFAGVGQDEQAAQKND